MSLRRGFCPNHAAWMRDHLTRVDIPTRNDAVKKRKRCGRETCHQRSHQTSLWVAQLSPTVTRQKASSQIKGKACLLGVEWFSGLLYRTLRNMTIW